MSVKISALPAASSVDSADLVAIVDVSAMETQKATVDQVLAAAFPADIGTAPFPTTGELARWGVEVDTGFHTLLAAKMSSQSGETALIRAADVGSESRVIFGSPGALARTRVEGVSIALGTTGLDYLVIADSTYAGATRQGAHFFSIGRNVSIGSDGSTTYPTFSSTNNAAGPILMLCEATAEPTGVPTASNNGVRIWFWDADGVLKFQFPNGNVASIANTAGTLLSSGDDHVNVGVSTDVLPSSGELRMRLPASGDWWDITTPRADSSAAVSIMNSGIETESPTADRSGIYLAIGNDWDGGGIPGGATTVDTLYLGANEWISQTLVGDPDQQPGTILVRTETLQGIADPRGTLFCYSRTNFGIMGDKSSSQWDGTESFSGGDGVFVWGKAIINPDDGNPPVGNIVAYVDEADYNAYYLRPDGGIVPMGTAPDGVTGKFLGHDGSSAVWGNAATYYGAASGTLSTVGLVRSANATASVVAGRASGASDITLLGLSNGDECFVGCDTSYGTRCATLRVYANSAIYMGTGAGSTYVAIGSATTALLSANVSLFDGTGSYGSGTGVVFIKNAGGVPSTDPVGGHILYAEGGALKGRGSSGTVTPIATADPHCETCGRDFALQWENDRYDEKLFVCVPCMLVALEGAGIKADAFSSRRLAS